MANTTTDLLLNPVKNLLINGVFQVDQRYASSSSSPIDETTVLYSHGSNLFRDNPDYGPDRWVFDWDGTTSAAVFDIYREDHIVGQQDVPGAEKYLYWNVTTIPTSATYQRVSQKIENVNNLQSKKAGISFWAKGDAAFDINISMIQNFGTGGSPSAEVQTAQKTKSLTTEWKYYELIIDVPSISGKTIGTDGNHTSYIELRLDMPAAAFGLHLSNVSVVEGNPKQYQFARGDTWYEELELMQRYFEKSYDLETAPGSNTTSGALSIRAFISGNAYTYGPSFAVQKRTTPTSIVYADITGSPGNVYDVSSGVNRGSSINCNGTRGFSGVASNPGSGHLIRYHWTSDAEL